MSRALPDVLVRYIEAYNQQDVDGMLELVTEDVVFENISNGAPPVRTEGRAELERLARQSAGLFTTRSQRVTDAVVGDDRVALMIDYQATVAVDLPNGWKRGQTIRLRGASFFELRGERMSRIVDFS